MERRLNTSRAPDSPSHLTEFTPLSDDLQPSSSFSWTRFFKKTKGDVGASSIVAGGDQTAAASEETSESISRSSLSDQSIEQNKYSIDSESKGGSATSLQRTKESEIYTRSFTNVLRRISNILDRRLSSSNTYKDSDFKQYWMPDEDCKECYDCGDRFTTFRRRHHCRVCGQIFCGRCCNQEIPGKIIGCSGDLRVCKFCCKVVLSYLQTADVMADSSTSDLRCLHEDLQNKLSLLDNQSDSSTYEFGNRVSIKRKNSVGFREQGFLNMPALNGTDATLHQRSRELRDMGCNTSELKLLTEDSTQLRELWSLIQNPINGIQFHNHRHRLMTYPSCVVGSELVDWLIAEDKACTRLQAVAICQALIDSNYLEPVSNQEKVFLDEYALYRAGPLGIQETSLAKMARFDHPEHQEGQEPMWVKEINQDTYGTGHDTDEYVELSPAFSPKVEFQRLHSSNSMFYVTLDTDETTVTLSKLHGIENVDSLGCSNKLDTDVDVSAPNENLSRSGSIDISRVSISDDLLKGALVGNLAPSQDTVDELSVPVGWHSVLGLRQDNGEKIAYERLSVAYEHHERSLLSQLLNSYGLAQSWSDIILPIVRKVAETVRPDERHDCDDMDIRQYVQFKKISAGRRTECAIINGVVCTKNVVHKKMKKNIVNPTILLVKSPIVYQRQENKLLSLEPAVLQEHNYLKNVVAKIASFKPDIVLVEKTVSRVAQDFLLDLDITLILNVKPSVLERVARLTQGEIVSSIDAQITKPIFGMCHSFRLVSYPTLNGATKTLMFFDGCAQHLGCTVILRGAGVTELAKVKKITQFMTYVYFNWRLERSFLMDEFALPPSLPEEKSFVIDDGHGLFQESRLDISTEVKEDCTLLKDGHSVLDKISTEDGFCQSETRLIAGDAKLQNKPSNQLAARQLSSEDDLGAATVESDRPYRERKCAIQSILDHSDPLRSFQKNEDDSVFYAIQDAKMQVSSLPLVNSFKKSLDDTILSVSPNSKYTVPYLESETGRRCRLRKYFAEEVYWSEQLCRPKKSSVQQDLGSDCVRRSSGTCASGTAADLLFLSPDCCFDLGKVEIRSFHLFTTLKLSVSLADTSVQEALADYRARGGSITLSSPQEQDGNLTNGASSKGTTDNAVAYNSAYWVDALDPFNHQRLSVLFCSYSYVSFNAPSFCVSPWIVNMHFYGPNDIPLGEFLEKYCFRTSYVCPSETCETPMTEHVRRFVHDNGCVHILLRKMEHSIKRWPDAISMWSWCRKCKQVTNVVPMSLDTWSLSFAKYLELRFHGGMYLRRSAPDGCTHSLHHDHYQYFAYKQIVTAFKYSPIILREIALPELVIVCHNVLTVDALIEDIKNLSIKGHGVFGTILERLFTLKSETSSTACEQIVADLLIHLQVEKNLFREKIEEIQIRLTSPTLENVNICEAKGNVSDVSYKVAKDHLWSVSDCVVNLKRFIAETVASWDVRFNEIIQQRKKDEKASKPTLGNIKTVSASIGSHVGASVAETVSPKCEDSVLSSTDVSGDCLDGPLTPALSISKEKLECGRLLQVIKCEEDEEEQVLSFRDKSTDTANGIDTNDCTSSFDASSSICLSSHEKDMPDLQTLDSATTTSVSPEHCEVNVSNVESKDQSDQSIDGQLLESRSDISKLENKYKCSTSVKQDDDYVDVNSSVGGGKTDKKATGTVKNMLSQLLSTSTTVSLQNPFGSTEHCLLPRCEKLPIIVYEDEPSSIIAYALSSPDYELAMQEQRLVATGQQQKDSRNSSPVLKRKSTTRDSTSSAGASQLIDGVLVSSSDNVQGTPKRTVGSVLSLFRNCERGNSGGGGLSWPGRFSAFDSVHYTVNIAEKDALADEDHGSEKDLLPASSSNPNDGDCRDKMTSKSSNNKVPNTHIEVQFVDNTAKFYCRIYFAEQFYKLRKLIFPDGEEAYARSLSRCVDWMAKGGKSGCTFRKTRDDRFVVKQMTRLEAQSFLDFAPHYINYITRAYSEQRPTVLTKILGGYRIVYRNIQTNATSKMDILVMENLFYGRNITQKFDLKGSVRNRMVNTSGKQGNDLVLLDENLLKMTCDRPLYIRPHSKTVFTLAISNDTQFLAHHLVMDYSLLVGMDDERKELAIGIIDYIRTFTWDKKLETFVKSSGFLGGQGKMPTVVSPELYRNRFCEAMDGYFLGIPDRWSNLGIGIEC